MTRVNNEIIFTEGLDEITVATYQEENRTRVTIQIIESGTGDRIKLELSERDSLRIAEAIIEGKK